MSVTKPATDRPPELPRMLSHREVQRLSGLTRFQIWRLVKEGKFPAPVQLGHRTRMWPEPVFSAWHKQLCRAGKPPGLTD